MLALDYRWPGEDRCMVTSDKTTSVSNNELRDHIQQLVGRNRRFRPSHLAIETVRACDAKHSMSPSESMERARGVMEPRVHKLILQKILDWGAPISLITHAGLSEPLLDRRLHARIALEKERFPSARVVVYSNGALLLEKRAQELLGCGLDLLSITLNGFHKTTFEVAMPIPREEIFERVERFQEMKRAAGSAMELHVSMVRTEPGSHEEVEEFKAYWKGRADAVVLPKWVTGDGLLDPVAPAEQYSCGHIWKTITIDFDGTVKMCREDHDTRYPTGSLVTQDPEEIFNSQHMLAQRSAQLQGEFHWPDICRNCVETHDAAQEFWQNPDLAPLE
jgi:radical SAM protein with 4Fe4S-binding SPASM domain